MKKLVMLAGGVCAAVSMAVAGTHAALADPSIDVLNVIGEPYGKAVGILKNQGVKATFGGSIGSDLPQVQCVVIDQRVLGSTMSLRTDCTVPKGQEKPGAPNTHSLVPPGGSIPGAAAGQRPTPGAGTVTVTPVPVG